MPTAYEQTYGEVTFYDLSGTKIYAMTADLGLWLVEDTEPSPDPKWVRVDVPGADGAVDLSRALAGQVTYEMRDITLRFGGKRADHATALALVRTLRSALHGARVRIKTMLTGLVSGYYVADCECDGTAHAGGEVEIEVRAWADPFIRVGTHTLLFSQSLSNVTLEKCQLSSPPAALLRGVGHIDASFPPGAYNPLGATSARLWWARGANLLDPSRLAMRAWTYPSAAPVPSDVATTFGATVDGQTITLGSIDAANDYKVDLLTSARKGVSIASTGIPFLDIGDVYGNAVSVGVFLSGSVTAVSSPHVRLGIAKTASTGADGWVWGTLSEPASTMPTTPAANTEYGDELVCTGTVSVSSADTEPLSALWVRIGGITGTDIRVRVSIVSGSTPPTTWEAADLGYATVDFGGSWCSRMNISHDSAVIQPWGEVTTTHRCRQTANPAKAEAQTPETTTTGSIDGWPPSDATALCLAAVNMYGEPCATSTIKATYYFTTSVTVSNTDMRATPTVTSNGGAFVAIGTVKAIVPPGSHDVPELTIPSGQFSVEHATLGGTSGRVEWEGGVL